VTRASLYKSLSKGGNPEFFTIAKVCEALGVKLVAVQAH
jgi:probable addiction module antidote protein